MLYTVRGTLVITVENARTCCAALFYAAKMSANALKCHVKELHCAAVIEIK